MDQKLPEQRNSTAWLLRATSVEAGPLFSQYLDSSPSLLRGVEIGDAVCLVSHDGFQVVGSARVYRTRAEAEGTCIYFDGHSAILPGRPLTEFGIELAADRNISRLDWSKFEQILSSTTGIPFDELPVFNGKMPEEQAYLRQLLQLATIDDLLGPACGPEEEIVGMSVRDRYLVGKLSPQTREDGDIEGLKGPLSQDAPAEGTPTDLEPFAEVGEGRSKGGRRRLPGEEFPTTGGASDPDDDNSEAIDASKNQSFVPSSFGFTFCVDGAVDSLELEVRWGRYERTESEEQFNENGNPMRAWKRIPSGGRISLPMFDGLIKPTAPDANCPQVAIQGTVRPPLPSGDRLVTVFLINNQPMPDSNQDQAWVFQPELIVRSPKGEAIFRRRPVLESNGHDQERESLEMIYRRRVEFAVGHSVSVRALPSVADVERATEIRTVFLPQYEVAVTETPGLNPEDRPAMRRMVEEGFLDMETLAELEPGKLVEALSILTNDYEAWISEQRARIGADVVGYDDAATQAMDRCGEILIRLREGILAIESNQNALQAFRFANRSMATQRIRSIYALQRRRKEEVKIESLNVRRNRSWRPFQLAFILLSIPALVDPKHKDRTKPLDAFADLLWFPTGGGKTEAYLGVATFTMAMRRLQGNLGGLDGTRGLAVIMRYTLRLLTLQQFQRASTLICAMEVLRRKDEKTWGTTPFSLGLWVGMKVTPNDTEQSHDSIEAERTGKRPMSSSPAQLTSCPWCGSEIAPGRDIHVSRFGSGEGRTMIYCGDKMGRCDFSRAKSKEHGLPVLVVDDELYRRPPSMLIATVDKFAMMAWRGQVRTLFGRATKECPRHGLLWPGAECSGQHQKRGMLPAVKPIDITPIRPPDLIIQDEFHLISGPLGTMVGLYETAVDELATWNLDGMAIRPKVIASTATVRKAAEQVNNVFLRRVAVFPPHGLDVEDNFFSSQRPIEEKPGRMYMGICAPGSARPAVLIRLYTALLTAAQSLFERFGAAADPWMTTVGYFNSLRELGGMRRLAEDDVQTRAYRVQMSRVARPGLAQRSVKNVDELTSRVSSKDIPAKLDQLEVTFSGEWDSEKKAYVVKWIKGEAQGVDVVLATNMLSVGVDVNRLGLMAVNGQPKSTAEYIQATSRVGRSFPGLVCTVLTWTRPRDLSHFETFEHYHATFYKHVEAQSVTPFAPRALDRGLTGTMVSWLRLLNDDYNPNLGAERMDSATRPEVTQAKKVLSNRGWQVSDQKAIQQLTEDMVEERCDDWIKEATRGGRRLGYEAGKKRKIGEDDVAALLKKPGHQAWDHFTVPMSLREVEPGVRLIMIVDSLPEGPPWRPRIGEDGQGGAA
ncbi:DISARM system helicase DrmA [Botrimarina sp.]|uniref:DISARM system helicase DrmA n=1 Tax=Botrimarina sp. TaxID=2795802 RepID=UPI0032EEB75F